MSEVPPPDDAWRAPDTTKPSESSGTPLPPPVSLSKVAPGPPPPPTQPPGPPPGPPPGQAAGGWGAPPPAYNTGYGIPGAAPWQPPPKPGVVPLHPLGLGELLDGAVQTMRQNPRVMLGLSAAVMAVVGVLSTGFMVVGLPRLMSAVDSPEGEIGAGDISNLVSGGFTGFVVPVVLQVLATIVLSGMLTVAVSEAVLGRRPSAGQVWAKARPRVLALIGLSLLTGLLVTLAVAVFVLPGAVLLTVSGAAGGIALLFGVPAAIWLAVWASIRLAFAAPALLLEDLGVVASMRRSWRLVHGSWWRMLGVLLLTSVIASVANGLLQAPFSIIGGVLAAVATPESAATAADITPMLVISTVVGNIGAVIASTVSAPFVAAVTALLYIDLRIRREGLDVALARAAQK